MCRLSLHRGNLHSIVILDKSVSTKCKYLYILSMLFYIGINLEAELFETVMQKGFGSFKEG